MNGEVDRGFWAEFARPQQSWAAWAAEIGVALVLAVIALFLVGCAHVEPHEELDDLVEVLAATDGTEDALAALAGDSRAN